MLSSKKTTNHKSWQECGEKGTVVLLVETYTDAATMENSMEVPQKIKNRAIIQFSNSASGYLSEENKTVTQEDICTPIFIHTERGILPGHKKE